MDTNIQQPDDTSNAINNQNSTRGKEGFVWRREKKSELSKEEKKMEEERTKDNFDSLDDIVNIGFTLAAMAFFGITLTNLRSIDGRDQCDVCPDVVKIILETGGDALMLLSSSAFFAIITKFIAKGFKHKKKDKIKNMVLKFGKCISVGLAATGCILLAIYLGYVFEVKFGKKGCIGLTTRMANGFLSWGVLGGSVVFCSALFDTLMG